MDTKVYRRGELSQTIKRFIKEEEVDLERKCRKIWHFTNWKGETYLFGSFCKNRNKLIVTLGYFNPCVDGHFIPTRN